MGVDNYKTVSKLGVEEMVIEANKIAYMISNPIEHYSIEEIIKIAELAKQNDLVLSVRNERSNFYQGVLLTMIKRSSLYGDKVFIDLL